MHVLYRKDGKLSWYFTMLSKGQKKGQIIIHISKLILFDHQID